MQRLEKRDECSCLGRPQVLSVGRHVAATLDYLSDQLIVGEPESDLIQFRSAFPSSITQGVAVAALLGLKNKGALPLQGRTPFQVCLLYTSRCV